MAYSLIALLLVLFQWAVIGYGQVTDSAQLLSHLFIYGSPIYLPRYLLTQQSAFLETNPYILAMLAFHAVKYFFIYKSQVSDKRNPAWFFAIVLETAYLAYSGYLLY